MGVDSGSYQREGGLPDLGASPRFLVQRDQEAPRSSPWALFRARRRRWARAAEGGGGAFLNFFLVLLAIAPKKSVFFQIRNFKILATWAIEAHTKEPPTDFCFRIALGFVEDGPLLYLPSGY